MITCFCALFVRSTTRDSFTDTEHTGFLALDEGVTNQFVIQTNAAAAFGEPEQAYKAHTVAASSNGDHTRDHSVIACSHHSHMGAILCAHAVRGEPRIQRHAKRWQQNHSLRNFCSKWIFAEGSAKADYVSFAATICITLV